MGAEQEGDESLGGNGGILYFSRNLVVCLGGNKIIYKKRHSYFEIMRY